MPQRIAADNTDALAVSAAAGDACALGQLWALHRGLLFLLCRNWYNRHRDIATAHGLALDDLEQESFFALQYAAAHYDQERGAFPTMLRLAFKKHLRDILLGAHVRIVSNAAGHPVQVSANPLDDSSSLDEVLPGKDGDGATRGDLVEDPAAQAAFDSAEDRIFTAQLHDALDAALATLTPRQAEILKARYYDGKTLASIAADCGISLSRVAGVEKAAMLKLRQRAFALHRFRDEIAGHVYQGTGLAAWENVGSIEEQITEKLERNGLL